MRVCCGGKYLPLRDKYPPSVFATVANTNLRSKNPHIVANTHINLTLSLSLSLSLSLLSYKNYVLLNGLTRSLSKASQKAT